MPTPNDLKRCTKCGEEKPRAGFGRDHSRKERRAPWCKACVRRWQQENAEHLADYHRRCQQEHRDKQRACGRRYREKRAEDPQYLELKRARDRRYRERKREDPDYRERRRAQNRRYRERTRPRTSADDA